MKLEVGKRYLIVHNGSGENTKINLDEYVSIEPNQINELLNDIVSEVIVDEISISGKYVKFVTYTGFPINGGQWERIDMIDILEELSDKKKENNQVSQSNVSEKLLEILTKMLDKKINKCKVGRKHKCVKPGFEKHKK